MSDQRFLGKEAQSPGALATVELPTLIKPVQWIDARVTKLWLVIESLLADS